MAELIPASFKNFVNSGEERLIRFLQVNLPENYYLLPNLEIAATNPRNNVTQYWEYDLLVLAPHAIFCIENKDWKGRLEGDDSYWYLNDKQKANPLKLGRQKTAILHSKLTQENLEWKNVWVQNMVTLSHPTQNKQGLAQTALKLTFLLNEQLLEFITNPEKTGQRTNDLLTKQDKLISYLTGKQSVKKPEQKKELLGQYEILEILNKEINYTEYLVKLKGVTSSIRKRIKEYALDVNGDAQWKNKVRNQFIALEKIKGKSFIMNVTFFTDDENHLFYEVTDFYDEKTLRAELKAKTFTNEQRIGIISDLMIALKSAHDEGVYHREINPDNIYILGGHAYLSNFGKAWFTDHDEMGYTVASTITATNITPYHALELLSKEASRASDIYSLGVLIYELFVGNVPVNSALELNKLGGKLPLEKLPTHINPSLPKWLDEVCKKTVLCDEYERFDSLDELHEFLKKSLLVLTDDIQEEKKGEDALEYKVGEKIGIYTIYKELGKGGFSKVFQVKHDLTSQVYAMKLFHESVSLHNVIAEYESLKEIDHPNIIKFIYIDRTVNGQFYTLMEYLEGENLKFYVTGELRLPTQKVYQVADDILGALVSMQKAEKPIFHRDIKPQNIVWDKQERFVLIDFNVATALENNKDYVGTNPYLAPDLIVDGNKVNWDKSADTFALGITLYELVCKQYPWKNKIPLIGTPPAKPSESNPNISDEFSKFLFKAVQPRKDDRFSDAESMLSALHKISIDNLLKPAKEETHVGEKQSEEESFITYLNSLYSQSRYGNSGTRAKVNGSKYDNETYVETKLDKQLLPAILDGNYKLIIITGNAGDGKTAFIRKIEQKAKNIKYLEHQNGASFKINGVPFLSNYDGSQDEANKLNNEVLTEFLNPFAGLTNLSQAKEGRIIAINEGRLVEFLQDTKQHKFLKEIIEKYFYSESKLVLPDGLAIINLNLRSVVAASNGDESILKRQIRLFTKKDYWHNCDGCKHSSHCFMRYNVQTLSDSSAGPEIIHRLEWLLRTISLKREIHITIRDLRSFIAYMITRDKICEEIEELYMGTSNSPENYWDNFYFNITATTSDNATNDRLINLVREIDIAETSIPDIDRNLFFSSHSKQDYLPFEEREIDLLDWFNYHKQYIPVHEQTPELNKRIQRLHKNYIRHQFFEGKFNFFLRIPYQSVYNFCQKLRIIETSGEDGAETTIKNISRAISYNEGCDNRNITDKYLVLSPSQVGDPFSSSYRIFNLYDFELKVNLSEHLIHYLEFEPYNLTFRHNKERKIKIEISLDLYEMLYFIGKGFSPSLNDLRGRYIELKIFKNLLENLTYNEVIVTKDNIEFFKISKNSEGKMGIKKFETV